MVVDALAGRSGATGRATGDAWLASFRLGQGSVLLVKPLSFMNGSGVPVARLLAEREASPGDLVVVVDDVALDLGTVRVRERGGHGGHNGLRSIVDVLGTEEFARVRVGVRRAEPGPDLAEYVLAEFPPEESLVVQEAVGLAADAVVCLLEEGAQVAMSRFNGRRL